MCTLNKKYHWILVSRMKSMKGLDMYLRWLDVLEKRTNSFFLHQIISIIRFQSQYVSHSLFTYEIIKYLHQNLVNILIYSYILLKI